MKKTLTFLLTIIMWSIATTANAATEEARYADPDPVTVAESSSSQTPQTKGKPQDKVTPLTSAKQLAIYPLFEKYKRNRNTNLSIIGSGEGKTYMELSVTNSPAIIEEITNLVEKDMKKTEKTIQEYTENSDEITFHVPVNNNRVTIIFTKYLNNNNCTLTLLGKLD